jgi:hypothetical protein
MALSGNTTGSGNTALGSGTFTNNAKGGSNAAIGNMHSVLIPRVAKMLL